MFSKKRLKVVISKWQTTVIGGVNIVDFGKSTQYTFTDAKISCTIKKVPATCGYTASIDIYGVSQTSLNQITNIAWIQGQITPMGVTIYADDGNGFVQVFEGGVMEATPNYQNVPDVSIHIESSMMVYPNLKKVPPISLTKNTIISDFCKELCSKYDYGCKTSPELSLMFWKGTTKEFNQKDFGSRIKELCRVAGLSFTMGNNSVEFYKRGEGVRRVWNLDKTQYDGYPTFKNTGMTLRVHHITTKMNCGDGIRITGSIVPQANAYWEVISMSYKLETWKENGAWDIDIHCIRVVEND